MTTRRNTRQRQMVLDEVRSRCDHPNVEQIYTSIHDKDPRMSRATVYRNLHLLADEGEILSIRTPWEEHFDLRTDDHPHIICTHCGCVEDVPLSDIPKGWDAALIKRVSEHTKWAVISKAILFEGICPRCLESLDMNN